MGLLNKEHWVTGPRKMCLCLARVWAIRWWSLGVLTFGSHPAFTVKDAYCQGGERMQCCWSPRFTLICSSWDVEILTFCWCYLQGVALRAVTLERRSLTREQDPLGESLHDPKVPQSSSAWTRCHLWTRKQCSSSPWWQAFPHYPCASRPDSG